MPSAAFFTPGMMTTQRALSSRFLGMPLSLPETISRRTVAAVASRSSSARAEVVPNTANAIAVATIVCFDPIKTPQSQPSRYATAVTIIGLPEGGAHVTLFSSDDRRKKNQQNTGQQQQRPDQVQQEGDSEV